MVPFTVRFLHAWYKVQYCSVKVALRHITLYCARETAIRYPDSGSGMTLFLKNGVLRYLQLSTSLLTVVVTQGVRGTQRIKL